jgi:hypothetical protein
VRRASTGTTSSRPTQQLRTRRRSPCRMGLWRLPRVRPVRAALPVRHRALSRRQLPRATDQPLRPPPPRRWTGCIVTWPSRSTPTPPLSHPLALRQAAPSLPLLKSWLRRQPQRRQYRPHWCRRLCRQRLLFPPRRCLALHPLQPSSSRRTAARCGDSRSVVFYRQSTPPRPRCRPQRQLPALLQLAANPHCLRQPPLHPRQPRVRSRTPPVCCTWAARFATPPCDPSRHTPWGAPSERETAVARPAAARLAGAPRAAVA